MNECKWELQRQKKFIRLNQIKIETEKRRQNNIKLQDKGETRKVLKKCICDDIFELKSIIFIYLLQIEMYGPEVPGDASVAIILKGIALNTMNPQPRGSKVGTYSIVASDLGKTIYSTTHTEPTGWNDQFVVNMSTLQNYDFDLVAFVNDRQVGKGKLSMLDIARDNNVQGVTSIPLFQNNQVVGQITYDSVKFRKQEIIGGLAPPFISLRGDYIHRDAEGIQKIKPTNLNFFSCMDRNDLGWEFFPPNYKTKLTGITEKDPRHSNESKIMRSLLSNVPISQATNRPTFIQP